MTAYRGTVSARPPARAVRDLVRAVAARCRGRTAVVGDDARLVDAIAARGIEAVRVEPSAARDRLIAHAFRTVVVTRTLEYLDVERGADLLAHAWAAVSEGGRLVVVVPNQGLGQDPQQRRRFDRKTLKRTLAALGEPRIAGDQPYRWLTVFVERPRDGARRPNRARRARYRATARLCRGRVIELGCGEGHLSRLIHDRGHEVVGVDLAAKKVAEARRLHPDIPFVHSDIRALELSDESFDTVILAEVLEHVREVPGAEILARAWRLVAPGGRLVVSVPNERMIPHPHHVREFDRRGLRRLLAPLGRPRLVADQPYKWLLMHVEKRA